MTAAVGVTTRTHRPDVAAYTRELVDAATRRLNADPNRDAILAKQKAARLRNHLRLHRITRGPYLHNGKKPTHRKARP